MTYDALDDDEWVEEEDDGDDEDDCVLLCPACGADVHEDTQQCPHCGDWITPVYPQHSIRRIVFVGCAIFLVVALILLAVR